MPKTTLFTIICCMIFALSFFSAFAQYDTDYIEIKDKAEQIIDESKLSLIYTNGDHYAFQDKASGFMSDFIFDAIWDDFCVDEECPILVWKNDKYGYANRRNGAIVIDFLWDITTDDMLFNHGYAQVGYMTESGQEQFALIDPFGNKVECPPGFDPASGVQTDNGILVLLERDDYHHLNDIRKYHLGIIKENHCLLVPDLVFQRIGRFSDGLASFSFDGIHYGFINTECQIQIEPIFFMTEDEYLQFSNGICLVRLENGEEVYINSVGIIIN